MISAFSDWPSTLPQLWHSPMAVHAIATSSQAPGPMKSSSPKPAPEPSMAASHSRRFS